MSKAIQEREDNKIFCAMGDSFRFGAKNMVLFSSLICLGLVLIGLAPNQAERPPQPFFQDFFSGRVTVQGSPPGEGTWIVACIGGCADGFESSSYALKGDGTFDQLEVNPGDETLVGHLIQFFLFNEFGRIMAVETRPYVGVFDFYVQDLTFVDPIPVKPPAVTVPMPARDPTPRPAVAVSLPVAGDPLLAGMPKIALVVGMGGVIMGAGLIFKAGSWSVLR